MPCLVTSPSHATKKVFQEVTEIQLLQGCTVQHDESCFLPRHENNPDAIATTQKIRSLLNVGAGTKTGQIILVIFCPGMHKYSQ